MTTKLELRLPPMSLTEAAAVIDALRTVKDVLTALCCQPRFKSAPYGYNEAGEFLDDLAELVGHAVDHIAEVAEAAQPDEASDDFASRATILIMDAFHCEGVVTAAGRAIDLYGKAEG